MLSVAALRTYPKSRSLSLPTSTITVVATQITMLVTMRYTMFVSSVTLQVCWIVLLLGPRSTGSDAQIIVVLELIGMLCFIPFLGYLYSILRDAEGAGWLAPTAFGAGLVDLTIKLGSIAPAFAAQLPGLAPQLHDALHKMISVAFSVTMLPIGVMLAAGRL